MSHRFYRLKTRIFAQTCPVGRKFCKEIELPVNGHLRFFAFFKNTVGKRLHLQFGEQTTQFVLVGFDKFQIFHIEVDGHIGFDGGEEVTHLDIVDMFFHFLAQLTLDFARPFNQSLDTSKLVDEFHGCFLTDTRTAWEIVG